MNTWGGGVEIELHMYILYQLTPSHSEMYIMYSCLLTCSCGVLPIAAILEQ